MENRSASEALPPGREREVRRLRFADPELERAFRHGYAEKSRRYLRIVISLLLILPIMILVGGVLQGSPMPALGLPPAQRSAHLVWVFQGLTVLIYVGALALTWSRRFPRLFQPYMAFLCLFMGTTLMVRTLPAPDGIGPLVAGALVTYTLYRLRFVAAVLVYWTLIAFFLGYSLWVLHTPIAALGSRLGSVVAANFFGMLAGYALEHSARRDFLLSRLLAEEREKSERLLLNILPAPVAERLKERPGTVADSFDEVTVLFADIVDFTPLSARLSAEGTVELLNEVFSCFDRLAEKHGLEKIKTIGDAYMVVGGLPQPQEGHAEAVLRMAFDMQEEISRFRRPERRAAAAADRDQYGPRSGGSDRHQEVHLRSVGRHGEYGQPHGVAWSREHDPGHRGDLRTRAPLLPVREAAPGEREGERRDDDLPAAGRHARMRWRTGHPGARLRGRSSASMKAAGWGASSQKRQEKRFQPPGARWAGWLRSRRRGLGMPDRFVREMEEGDAAAVSHLLAECYRFLAERDGLTAPQLAALLETRACPEHVLGLRAQFRCFVAELEGAVAGMAAIGEGSIEDLFVLPRFHRRGVGTALFRHAERRLRESGHQRLTLTTTGYGRPFYEVMGMQVTGTCLVSYGPLEGRELLVLEKQVR